MPMRLLPFALVSVLVGCGGAPSVSRVSTPTAPSTVAPRQTVSPMPPVHTHALLAPIAPGCLVCSTFGLVHRDDGWYVALAEQRDSDETGTQERAGLRHVADGLLGPSTTIPPIVPTDGWPITMLDPPSGPAPWLVTSRSGFGWMVRQIGAGRGTGLGSGPWPELEGSITRAGWHLDALPRATVLWQRDTTRPLTRAERQQIERQAQLAQQQGLFVDFAPNVTVRTALYASVATPTSRHDELVANVSAQSRITFSSPFAVENAHGGLVGFRVDAPTSSSGPPDSRAEHWIWLDEAGVVTAHRTEVAAAGEVAQAYLRDDGVAILVSMQLDVGGDESLLDLRLVPPSGPITYAPSIRVMGNLTDAVHVLACGGQTWLVTDAFQARAGTHTLEARTLAPDGSLVRNVGLAPLPGRHEPSQPGSRPAEPMEVACAGDEAALATIVPTEGEEHGVALVTWHATP